jgi:hypothetical protein
MNTADFFFLLIQHHFLRSCATAYADPPSPFYGVLTPGYRQGEDLQKG